MDSPSRLQSTTTPAPVAATAEAALDLTGQTLGDFHILRRLGEGGMGQVYLAEQISLKRKVALKLLRADLAANATALARFRAEAEAVARATHANIVQVYAIGEVNGLNFMALEYVEGRNLRQYLEKKGPPEVMLALSIMRQVAAALQRASELGIIHRDIKPENILLTRKGEVKVADFGLSRIFGDDRQPLNLTQSGVTMGTPLYMSPEQVEGKPVDPRTDIYSFGVTCYHLLAGEPPFRGQTAFEVAVQHVQQQPAPLAQIRPDLPAELCALVHRMMAKNPDDRLQTGREVVREIMRLRDNLIAVAVTGGVAGTLRPGMIEQGDDSGGHQTHVIQLGPGGSTAFDATLTQSLPQRASPYWWWLAALSVVAALGMGMAYGWWRGQNQLGAHQEPPSLVVQPAPEPTSADPKALAALPKEEQRLLDAVKQHDGASKYRIDLAAFYLKHGKLDEADKEFKTIHDSADKQHPGNKAIGLLGKGIVLAFRDQPEASNQVIVGFQARLKGSKDVSPYHPFWLYSPVLSEWVAKALDRNYANDPAAFPAALKPYRTPPPAKVKAPA
jgi:tRNA A-37 threonylcarbamoyl transferase component Bud32